MQETVQETRTREVILLSNFHVPLEMLLTEFPVAAKPSHLIGKVLCVLESPLSPVLHLCFADISRCVKI